MNTSQPSTSTSSSHIALYYRALHQFLLKSIPFIVGRNSWKIGFACLELTQRSEISSFFAPTTQKSAETRKYAQMLRTMWLYRVDVRQTNSTMNTVKSLPLADAAYDYLLHKKNHKLALFLMKFMSRLEQFSAKKPNLRWTINKFQETLADWSSLPGCSNEKMQAAVNSLSRYANEKQIQTILKRAVASCLPQTNPKFQQLLTFIEAAEQARQQILNRVPKFNTSEKRKRDTTTNTRPSKRVKVETQKKLQPIQNIVFSHCSTPIPQPVDKPSSCAFPAITHQTVSFASLPVPELSA